MSVIVSRISNATTTKSVKGLKMKKLLGVFLLICAFSGVASAYIINDKYFSLKKCEWGQMGYKWGYIGHYQAIDGESVKIFFGESYCEY